nr:MAG TPA: hypothetical protein [Bacteriophage sp.]
MIGNFHLYITLQLLLLDITNIERGVRIDHMFG